MTSDRKPKEKPPPKGRDETLLPVGSSAEDEQRDKLAKTLAGRIARAAIALRNKKMSKKVH